MEVSSVDSRRSESRDSENTRCTKC